MELKTSKKNNQIIKEADLTKRLEILYVIILLLGVVVMGTSISRFYSGFHDVDLGMNMNVVGALTNQVFVDVNSRGETWTSLEMYRYGQGLMQDSFFLFGIGCAAFGLALTGLLTNKKERKQK